MEILTEHQKRGRALGKKYGRINKERAIENAKSIACIGGHTRRYSKFLEQREMVNDVIKDLVER